MHDVHTLERTFALPTIAIVSAPFASAAIFQASALHLAQPERHIVLAEHPISDCSFAELVQRADALLPDLMRQLTTNTPTSDARRRRLRAAEPSALCLAGA